MYIYVAKAEGLSRVPDTLLKRLGTTEHAMTLVLHAERVLVGADVNKVMESIETEGFFLQLSASEKDSYMTEIHNKNHKFQ